MPQVPTLSTMERLVLANQYRILEGLASDPEEAKALAESRTIVEHGYSTFYPVLFQHISDEIPKAVSEHVFNVFDMHLQLEKANDRLLPDQRFPLEDLECAGFDANNESDAYLFARYVTGEMGKYPERVPIRSAGHPTVHIYERMLRAWESSRNKYELSREDVERILSAREP